MNFVFTSGPSFVLTFVSLLAYAIVSHAPFEAYAAWATGLFVAHVGKRLLKFKIGQNEISADETNGQK